MTEVDNPQTAHANQRRLFHRPEPRRAYPAGTATVREGYLEGSNTSTVREMASMMTAMRGFEANQHVIQIQDDRLNRTITELGNPT